jgi:hypothetical protein
MKDIPRNVYPDHALIVALHVFANFKKASEALEEVIVEAIGLNPSKYPRMVCSDKVPGSGDGAWTCYKMLKHMKEKELTPETACVWADGRWVGLVGPGTGNFEDKLQDGLKAAREARSLFVEMAEKWDWN